MTAAAGIAYGQPAGLGAYWAVCSVENLFRRLPVHWAWWPTIGGLIVGAGGLIEPRAPVLLFLSATGSKVPRDDCPADGVWEGGRSFCLEGAGADGAACLTQTPACHSAHAPLRPACPLTSAKEITASVMDTTIATAIQCISLDPPD